MHPYTMPAEVKERVIRRQGKLPSHDTIDAARTAMVVVDMQNYFVAEGFPHEVPAARGIVPNINRLARTLRSAGGTMVWVQTTAIGALDTWGNHHKYMMTPERVKTRLAHLDEKAEGFALYPKLDALPSDLHVKKVKFSAFISGSSDIDAKLRSRGIESLLIAGTLTNVCCESTARDAMMLDYRVIMVADANATLTDETHAASLNNFVVYFGDVMTADDAMARLEPAEKRQSA
ncbi:MAG TPA: cysteine hydrolase [Xanthobacteraceae bacterium]|jgi:ureidoacrylate peracid hydrolase|nr:cysteine hydrolase [Xanthobacteraceae bacterium]